MFNPDVGFRLFDMKIGEYRLSFLQRGISFFSKYPYNMYYGRRVIT